MKKKLLLVCVTILSCLFSCISEVVRFTAGGETSRDFVHGCICGYGNARVVQVWVHTCTTRASMGVPRAITYRAFADRAFVGEKFELEPLSRSR